MHKFGTKMINMIRLFRQGAHKHPDCTVNWVGMLDAHTDLHIGILHMSSLYCCNPTQALMYNFHSVKHMRIVRICMDRSSISLLRIDLCICSGYTSASRKGILHLSGNLKSNNNQGMYCLSSIQKEPSDKVY